MGRTGSQEKVEAFDCKDGCGEKVIYLREEVLGLTSVEEAVAETETKIVYLTCPNGHTNPYRITGGA